MNYIKATTSFYGTDLESSTLQVQLEAVQSRLVEFSYDPSCSSGQNGQTFTPGLCVTNEHRVSQFGKFSQSDL